jgi:brassinosteroid-6-oxidase 1
MVLVAIGVVVAAAVVVSSLLLRWNEVRYSRKRGLPPGTMGWPLFGETTEFLKQGPSFMKARRLRYMLYYSTMKQAPNQSNTTTNCFF